MVHLAKQGSGHLMKTANGHLSIGCASCTPLAPDDTSISANLQAWLKADAITGLSDGDAIGTWSDSSGNGNDATQSTSGEKPLYKTGIYSGSTLPTVRFDGTDDWLDWGSFFSSFETGGWTAFVVCKQTGAGGVASVAGNRQLIGANSEGFFLLGGDARMATYNNAIDYVEYPGLTNKSFLRYCGVATNDGSTRNRMFFDGAENTASVSGAALTQASSSANCMVGRIPDAISSTFYFTGDVCELIVYDTVLTDAQIAGVACYLKRWTDP